MAKKAKRAVDDYALQGGKGEVRLSRLSGRHDHLVVLHNMGKECPNCAIYGDEFEGMRRHVERVAAFCVINPDDPRTQAAYVKRRGWKGRIVSARGTSFIKDLGFEGKDGGAQPGVSVLARKNDRITVVDQVNVMRDGRCPSVLEVLWMIPGVEPGQLAARRGA